MPSKLKPTKPLKLNDVNIIPLLDESDNCIFGFVFEGAERENPMSFETIVNYAVGEYMVENGIWEVDL